jgi:acyl dehydratase
MVNWDRGLVGGVYSRTEQHVTRQALLDYASILGSADPVHVNPEAARAQGYHDIIALPSFVTWHGAGPIAPPAMAVQGIGINAGYDCTFYSPVYPDDTLTYTTRLADFYEKTGRSGMMRFVVRETTVTNQDDETVALLRNSFILGW